MTDGPVQTSAQPRILDPQGRPARRRAETGCPQCGAGVERRVKSGMGAAHPVCGRCGYEWMEEAWHDDPADGR